VLALYHATQSNIGQDVSAQAVCSDVAAMRLQTVHHGTWVLKASYQLELTKRGPHLHGVHCNVDAPIRQRLINLLCEQALPPMSARGWPKILSPVVLMITMSRAPSSFSCWKLACST